MYVCVHIYDINHMYALTVDKEYMYVYLHILLLALLLLLLFFCFFFWLLCLYFYWNSVAFSFSYWTKISVNSQEMLSFWRHWKNGAAEV